MPVVTISGMVGSGAREVGRLAAQGLGIDYVDQQLLVDAARRLGVPGLRADLKVGPYLCLQPLISSLQSLQ